MAHIEMHGRARGSIKIKRLARCLEISEHEALGLLTWFWLWSIEHVPGGDLGKLDDQEIEDAAGWRGAPGRFVAALREERHRFLDAGNLIHDWEDFTSGYRKATADRDRKRTERLEKKAAADSIHGPSEDSPRTIFGQSAERRADPIRSDPIRPDPIVQAPSFEGASPATSAGSAPASTSRRAKKPEPAPDPDDVVRFRFPLNADKTWELRQSIFEVLCAGFPAVDVEAEARKAIAWLTTNKTRRPKDGPAFFNRWCSREQDKQAAKAAREHNPRNSAGEEIAALSRLKKEEEQRRAAGGRS